MDTNPCIWMAWELERWELAFLAVIVQDGVEDSELRLSVSVDEVCVWLGAGVGG
jgi:hypothetical protein